MGVTKRKPQMKPMGAAEVAPLVERATGRATTAQRRPFTFTVSSGRTFKASVPANRKEMQRIVDRGKALAALPDQGGQTDQGDPSQDWTPFLAVLPGAGQGIATISACLIEPRLSEIEVARLLLDAPLLYEELCRSITDEIERQLKPGGTYANRRAGLPWFTRG